MSPSRTAGPVATPLVERILDAARCCVARSGLGGTTLGVVATEAGCSRASIYRAFPGGKEQLFADLGAREVDRFIATTEARVAATADLAEALVVGLNETARALADDPALRRVLAHEPEAVLPLLGFGEVDRLYEAAAEAGRRALVRFLPPGRAAWAGEWVARLVVSYQFIPATPAVEHDRAVGDRLRGHAEADLADPEVARRLVNRFLIPALGSAGTATSPQLERSRA